MKLFFCWIYSSVEFILLLNLFYSWVDFFLSLNSLVELILLLNLFLGWIYTSDEFILLLNLFFRWIYSLVGSHSTQYLFSSPYIEALTMHVQYGKFNEEQEEAITKVLTEIFCFNETTVTFICSYSWWLSSFQNS